jgi:hypothetical protein
MAMRSTDARVRDCRRSIDRMVARDSSAMNARTAATTFRGSASPEATIASARSNACEMTTAAARSSAESRTLREEAARPSASRTVGTPTISIGSDRSRTMRRMTVSC